MATYVRDDIERIANQSSTAIVAKCWCLGFVVPDSTFIYNCLLTSMAAMVVDDEHDIFLLVGDLNGHHQELLGYMTTNHHGIAVFDFSSGCDY